MFKVLSKVWNVEPEDAAGAIAMFLDNVDGEIISVNIIDHTIPCGAARTLLMVVVKV